MPTQSLAEKKAAVERLLEEFESHTKRVQEISREASAILEGISEEHGAEGIAVLAGLMQRLSRVAMKAQPTDGGVSRTVV